MSRPTIRQLIESGELDRLFRQCGSWAAVARHLGVGERTLRDVRAKWQALPKSATLPSTSNFANLGNTGYTGRGDMVEVGEDFDSGTDGFHAQETPEPNQVVSSWDSFDDEEPTQPGITAQSFRAASEQSLGAPVDVVPDRHIIKGVSSFVGPDGELKGQWIKTTAQNDERAEWLEAIRTMEAELPRVAEVSLPQHREDDLLAVYPVGDPHIGLLSWREDAGENFDLFIAEQRYVAAFKHLLDVAPYAHEALIVLIGDTAHADGQNNTTTKGTRVDVDGRTLKMARVIIRIARYAIDLALKKHGRVTMIVERGNHDELISAMLALSLSFVYEADPRVTIDTSPQMYHWFRFGANLIGTHHGDKAKPMDLLGVMAVDRADDWSDTKHRRFYCGHFHHQIVKEVPGLIVEYLPTLASSDAWHHAMGYRSSKAMYMDVFHREHGHINRHIVGLSQLRAA